MHALGFTHCIERPDKTQRTSRQVYEFLFGKLDRKVHVRHACDNPLCINPRHLVLGTARDNWLDTGIPPLSKRRWISELDGTRPKGTSLSLRQLAHFVDTHSRGMS